MALAVVAAAAPPDRKDGELVADGAWCWFQDPRAVHYVGTKDRTYIAYVTSTGDVEIVSQDAGTARLTHTTLQADFQKDDHAAPGISVQPDGRIAVFYSKHARGSLIYQVSNLPEDITSFGPPKQIPGTSGGATYGNPIYLPAEGRTYVFYRGSNWKPNVTWSTDLVNWSTPVTVVVPVSDSVTTRPYVKYASNGSDTILLSFTDGHPRNVPDNSIYSMTLRGGVFRAVDGTPLASLSGKPAGLQKAPVSTSRLQKVYDGSGPTGKGWVWSTSFDQSGNPVIVFATFPTDTDHRYWYARWNGVGWTVTEFAAAGGSIQAGGGEPNYSGGIEIDPNDAATVYTSRLIGAQWEIERWKTADGGLTFGAPEAVTAGSGQKNIRPVVPWGPPGEIDVLWMAGSYTHWRGNYKTQVRELTSGKAPTTTRVSASLTGVAPGQPLSIVGRVVQGYLGAAVPGASATLYAQATGQVMAAMQTVAVDENGLATFDVQPTVDTSYQVRFAGDDYWGLSTSPTVPIRVGQPSAVRLSTDRTVKSPQTSIKVGIRAVGSEGQYLPQMQVELWQQPAGGIWTRVRAMTTDANGLALVSLPAQTTMSYQARFPGTATHLPSYSDPRLVTVKKNSTTRIGVSAARATPFAAITLKARVVDKVTGVGLRHVAVQVWQKVNGGVWTKRKTLTTDTAGLATMTVRPDRSLSYQMRYVETVPYWSSMSVIQYLSITSSGTRTRVA